MATSTETRDELVAALAEIERLIAERITITRLIVNSDGREVGQRVTTVRVPREERTER
jgi:hypothetical protein